MKGIRRSLQVLAAWLLVTTAASAYYHFVHYTTRNAPFLPIPEKFDLASLASRTVPYYISENGPVQMASGDSLSALVSQIRLAARAWNNVETSDLRVQFGGLFTPGTPQLSPGIEVLFEEVPPGLLALGGPTARAELSTGPNGSFVPITRSVVILPRDLGNRPSFGENLFLSLVHEFGHALGLQHTLTSSVMSTGITRAATKARPLDVDDVAGISLLYPSRDFAASMGAIAGRVSLAGQGVSLASVVALSPQGGAVSTLTNPDGTFRLEGLPPGNYYLYAHPLPPPMAGEVTPANLVLPLDVDNRPIAPGATFETQFYPGTRDPNRAVTFNVAAGETIEGVQFNVNRRGPLQLYAVQTYSFPGQVAVKPAHISMGGSRSFLVASGFGLVANRAPAAGLQVSVLGGTTNIPQGGIRAYAPDPNFLQIDFQFSLFATEGPRHLIFSLNNDIYVLPSGFFLTQKQPPSITSLTPATDAAGGRGVALSGSNLSGESVILFDGVAGQVRGEDSGSLLVTPPAAASGHRAAVVALNKDGQSSLFLQGATPPFHEFDSAEPASFLISPGALPAGVEALIEVNGVNTGFQEGQTALGFGSSDIVVRRLWVASPTRILASVFVPAASAPAMTAVTVATGLRLLSNSAGFQVQPNNPRQISLQVAAVEGAASSFLPGTPATIQVSNLPANLNPALLTVTLNDRPLTILSVATGRITFQVPAGTAPGTAILRVQIPGEQSLPILVAIDLPPPVVTAAFAQPNTPIDSGRAARPGELLSLVVSGLAEPGAAVAPSRLRITVGGIEHQAQQVTPSGNSHQVQFFLGTTVAAGPQQLVVAVDSRNSTPFLLAVRAQ